MKDIPIVIPSYHRRANILLDHLKELSENGDRKIYLYIYKEEYDRYKDLSTYATIKQIDTNWRSIMKKRALIQLTMKEPVYWLLDDDLSINCKGPYNTDITLMQVLDYVEKHTDFSKDILTGPTVLAHRYAKGVDVKLNKMLCCCVLVNNESAMKNGIFYSADNIVEDSDISFQCIWKGFPTKRFDNYFVPTEEEFGGDNSIVSTQDKFFSYYENGYIKWGNTLKLIRLQNGRFAISQDNTDEIVNHNITWDEDLLRACKEHRLKDFLSERYSDEKN